MANWLCVTTYDRATPSEPGCYAIYKFHYLTNEKHLLYIGTAQNIKKRLERHELKRLLYALLEPEWLVYIKCKVMLDRQYRIKTEKKFNKKIATKSKLHICLKKMIYQQCHFMLGIG